MRQLRRLNRLELSAAANATISETMRDTSGTVIDLTGGSVQWRLAKGRPSRRAQPFSGNAKITKTATIVSAPAGTVTVALTPSDLQNLKGTYWQQFLVTDSAGAVTFAGGGEVFIVGEMGS